MAIKVSLGKLQLSLPLDTYAPHFMTANAIATLDIAPAHVFAVARLPFHHRDPFDRLLIAQAMIEQIALVSADTVFDAYGVTRLW